MTTSPTRPLAGLRVVDTADEKAELCGRLLADLGADVVRVEPPGGARSRHIGPFHGNASLYFAVRNANKRGLVLDLDDEVDRAVLLDLLTGADIWIETTRPGTLAAVGLDPREISIRFPHLVVTSITDFGQTGPYRDYVATDAVLEAMAWMLFRAGVPERPPVLPPGSFAYDVAGITGAFASLTAVLDRTRTGRGQHLDVSVIEAVQQTTDWGLASYSVISQMGGAYSQVRSGGGQIYPIVPCQDGWVRPSIVTKAEWHKVRAWLGEPEELQDEHWDASPARIEIYHDVIEPLLVEHFAGMTMVEASQEGQARRIPVTPLLRPGDVLAAEHYREIGTFLDAEVAPGVHGAVTAGFFVVDGERVGFRERAPELGDGRVPPWRADPFESSPDLGGNRARRPFAGLRVLDFGVAGAAPEIARLLGEYGADVIRVESPHRPDLFRQFGGPSGISPVFVSSSRTKRSFGVDFRDERGVALVKQLATRADLVVENLPPGTMDSWGLGWDALRAANPELVMISSQTMGTRGPWREWRGYGANTQPPGGLTYLWSFPDAEAPVGSNVAFPDHVVGRLGATIATALLIARGGRAAGSHVEIIQAEVAINLLSDLMLQESLAPGSVGPVGNRSARGAPWGVYPCAGDQRWCVITCRDDADWQGLRRVMGEPDWARAPELDTAAGRRARHDEVDERLAAWTSARADREVMETLQAERVPAGVMMYVGDVPTDPHLVARGYVLTLDQPGLGPMLLEGPGFHASALDGPLTTPAPRLGEHTRDIATSLLGLTGGEVDDLVASGTLAI